MIDFYEASVPTMPANLQLGDRVVTGPATAHTVTAVGVTSTGAYVTLRIPGRQFGALYTIHRKSAVDVLRP